MQKQQILNIKYQQVAEFSSIEQTKLYSNEYFLLTLIIPVTCNLYSSHCENKTYTYNTFRMFLYLPIAFYCYCYHSISKESDDNFQFHNMT